ncbi:MAG TPA: SpoIIE family protein phosphatase, partial [Vicingus sp.]|nr:SpoIIE family protein phosphatase [Vicingus sp.]
ILFLPRDIVSGDFYWISEKNGAKIIVVADCTGHGVPGAFVSMLGNDLLNQIINERGIINPSEILIQLNQGVQKAFKSDDLSTNSNDGMDISIVAINNDEMIYAGANRPIFIIRNKELIELKPDKLPIGGRTAFDFKYTNQIFQLLNDDIVYQLSDGYADQFGGINNKKFLTKRLKDLLLKNSELSLDKQKDELLMEFLEWKKDVTQLDDVLIVGIKVKI